MATTFYMPIDPGFVGTNLTLYATQTLTEIDSAAATITELASGDVIASATLDLSTAVDGTVNLTLRQVGTKIPAWVGTTVVSSGEGEGGDVELLAAIKAKTDLIGTGSATISAPVTDAGTIDRIVRGADYKVTNNRAFEWTFALIGNIADASAATCTFAGKKRDDATDTFSVGGTLSVVSGQHKATFELAAADTATLSLGNYEWSVEVIDDSGNKIVPVLTDRQRLTRLVEKFS